jgi:hypothetical protein
MAGIDGYGRRLERVLSDGCPQVRMRGTQSFLHTVPCPYCTTEATHNGNFARQLVDELED